MLAPELTRGNDQFRCGLLGCHELIQAGRFNWARVQVRAKERSAAFVALHTLAEGIPLLPTIEPLKMTEAPSGNNDRSGAA
jgi:hypothetical protein